MLGGVGDVYYCTVDTFVVFNTKTKKLTEYKYWENNGGKFKFKHEENGFKFDESFFIDNTFLEFCPSGAYRKDAYHLGTGAQNLVFLPSNFTYTLVPYNVNELNQNYTIHATCSKF